MLKQVDITFIGGKTDAAAFGRLCVETACSAYFSASAHMQPPSGGCVLKLYDMENNFVVLRGQPPSGGCVLKLSIFLIWSTEWKAAAFGRLCVETSLWGRGSRNCRAAAFGRLCVETTIRRKSNQ